MSTRRQLHWPVVGAPDPGVDPEGYELACDMYHEAREELGD